MRKYVLAIMVVSLMILSSCGKEESQPAVSEIINGDQEETSQAEEEVSEAEETTVEETTIENEDFNNWFSGLDSNSFYCAVWNEEEGTGTVLKQGETYTMKSGDQLYLHTPSKFESGEAEAYCGMKYGKVTDNYVQFDFKEQLEYQFLTWEITTKNGEKGYVENKFIYPKESE